MRRDRGAESVGKEGREHSMKAEHGPSHSSHGGAKNLALQGTKRPACSMQSEAETGEKELGEFHVCKQFLK